MDAIRKAIPAALVLACSIAACSSCGSGGGSGDAGDDSGTDTDSGTAELAAPRLIAPLSTAKVVTLRPTLRWVNEEDLPATLEISGTHDFEAVEYAWTGDEDEHAVAEDLAPGAHYWRVGIAGAAGMARSHAWEIFAGRQEYDVNGDGFSDLVIATDQSDFLYAFFGGNDLPGELTTDDADVVIERSNLSGGNRECSCYGDLTGDGVSDIVFGYWGGTGSVTICPGSPGIGGSFHQEDYCHKIFGVEPEEHLGAAFSTRGDVDLDGIDDLLASAPGYVSEPDNAGAIFLFKSAGEPLTGIDSSAGKSFAFVGDEENAHVNPWDIVGDFNGDGPSDLLFGSSLLYVYGKAWVVLGSPSLQGEMAASSADVVFPGTSGVGSYLRGASLGDLDGDGYGDVAFTYKVSSDTYTVRVIRGGADVLGQIDEGDLVTEIAHPAGIDDQENWFGVFGPGDVNGDGYADLGFTLFGNIGMPVWQTDPLGGVYVFYGGPDLAPELDAEDADVRIAGNGDPWFARGWGAVGDVNGDGLKDFAVAATGDTLGNDNDEFPGRVFVFYGGPALDAKETADDADLIISSTNVDESFGICINES